MAAEVDRNAEIDRDIDQLLDGLRRATASPGLGDRILRAAERDAAAPQASAWSQLQLVRPLKLAFVFAVGLTCAIALGVFLVKPRPLGHMSTRPQPIAATETPRGSLPASVPAPAQLTRTATHRKTAQSSSAELDQTARGNPPGAVAESFPAPPMPLTEQEKLLLRVAHRRDPANVAMLNPAAQATLIASEQAQFEKFFAPPPAPPTQPEVKDEGQSR